MAARPLAAAPASSAAARAGTGGGATRGGASTGVYAGLVGLLAAASPPLVFMPQLVSRLRGGGVANARVTGGYTAHSVPALPADCGWLPTGLLGPDDTKQIALTSTEQSAKFMFGSAAYPPDAQHTHLMQLVSRQLLELQLWELRCALLAKVLPPAPVPSLLQTVQCTRTCSWRTGPVCPQAAGTQLVMAGVAAALWELAGRGRLHTRTGGKCWG